MNRIPALKIVYKLAELNALDYESANDMDLIEEYDKQQLALSKVRDMLAGKISLID